MSVKVYKIEVGEIEANCYILEEKESGKAAIIDPGGEAKKIKDFLKSKGLTPSFIILTHGHIDHIEAVGAFNLPVYIHKDDEEFLYNPDKNLSLTGFKLDKKPKRLLDDGDKLQLGNLSLKIIHTPGHTPGGICILCDKILFSGDTLFSSGVGRTDFPYGNSRDLLKSIKDKLLILDDNIQVFPGHGPATTIGKEKEGNPWVGN